MLVIKAYRFELNPSKTELNLLIQNAGTARFAYNWGLRRRIDQFNNNTGKSKFTDYMKQQKELNAIKKSQFPWMYDVSKCAPQGALRDLDTAFKNFRRRLKTGDKPGFPRFKKKFIKDSFQLTGTLKVFDKSHAKYPKRVQLPRLGKIIIKEDPIKLVKKLETKISRIMSARVIRDAHKWYVNFNVEEEIAIPNNNRPEIGIDLGIKDFATLSNGMVIHNPRYYKSSLRKMKRMQKTHSRKDKGSKNRKKSVAKLSRLHYHVKMRRRDFLHKVTTFLAMNYSKIWVEDLKVRNMMQNHCLAQAISDVSWYQFKELLEYKCRWYGSELKIIDTYYPSTQLCSQCLDKQKMPLSVRTYSCPTCGMIKDRDVNAAINIKNYEKNSVVLSYRKTLNAPGGAP
ncbi:MAG: transposase [Candidatus Heimdallarchaeota archaeon]|nr:transposase [Candidatus Heimdallarchaeota archaeon]